MLCVSNFVCQLRGRSRSEQTYFCSAPNFFSYFIYNFNIFINQIENLFLRMSKRSKKFIDEVPDVVHCEKCQFFCETQEQLDHHDSMCHKVRCTYPDCGTVFNGSRASRNLAMHVEKVHMGNPSWCSGCGLEHKHNGYHSMHLKKIKLLCEETSQKCV